MKKRIIIATLIICTVILLVFLLIKILPLLFFLVFKPTEFFPTEGIWYCEELQLYLNFDMTADSIVVKNGEEIECKCQYMTGSNKIYIDRKSPETPEVEYTDFILEGEYVSRTETELVLRDVNSQQTYVFIKQ